MNESSLIGVTIRFDERTLADIDHWAGREGRCRESFIWRTVYKKMDDLWCDEFERQERLEHLRCTGAGT